MRKLFTGIAAMGMVLSMGVTTALAAGHGCGRNFVDADNNGVCDHYSTSCQFADADGDGICDNCGLERCGMGYVDADGDGICDSCGLEGCGMGYTDADGDGICDHYAEGRGRGNGQGRGNGRGCQNGFRGGCR